MVFIKIFSLPYLQDDEKQWIFPVTFLNDAPPAESGVILAISQRIPGTMKLDLLMTNYDDIDILGMKEQDG